VYLITWNGNTVAFILFTKFHLRDSLIDKMLKLITILIVYIFYWLCANRYNEYLLLLC
jgi:hypothetical protein